MLMLTERPQCEKTTMTLPALFELHFQDGRKIELHYDGRVDGVSDDTVVINRAQTLFHVLLAQQEISHPADHSPRRRIVPAT